ncbi:MAG: hypothetical protein DMG58_03785 [Acidobacteria bacterium]|nr:MAG: hypothetical protein DMG58_03785 [Acidobacteriota bacterium]
MERCRSGDHRCRGQRFCRDANDHRVRKITPDETISTVAGDGFPGFRGDRGPASAARLSTPHGVAVDSASDLFIADLGNNRVRKVSPDGNDHHGSRHRDSARAAQRGARRRGHTLYFRIRRPSRAAPALGWRPRECCGQWHPGFCGRWRRNPHGTTGLSRQYRLR